MSYLDYELSQTGGQPLEAYEFVGTYKTYRYTPNDVPVTINGQLYTPIPCERGDIITATQVDDNVDLSITMPALVDMVLDYAFNVSPPDLMMNVYRVHRGSNYSIDWILYWTGKVNNFTIEDQTATITIPGIFGMGLAGNIPTTFYQTGCNHVLFDRQCKVNRSLWQFNTTIAAVSGLTIQLADASPFQDQAIVGGQFLTSNSPEVRMIMSQNGSTIGLNYRCSPYVVAGASVQIAAGCGHTRVSCNKFNNQKNFGGFPYIPNYNPFTQGF